MVKWNLWFTPVTFSLWITAAVSHQSTHSHKQSCLICRVWITEQKASHCLPTTHLTTHTITLERGEMYTTWAFLCGRHLTVTIEESNRKKRKAQALQIHAAHVLMKWSISIMRTSLMLIISCCKWHVRKSQPGHPDIVWTPCVKTNMYRHTRVRKVVFFFNVPNLKISVTLAAGK